MKVLNLDALAKTNRTLTLGGKDHEVLDMTVENFIETTKQAERLGDKATIAEQMEATIEMIQRSVPTLKISELKKLNMEQLNTVLKFIRGELDNEEPAAKTDGGEPGKP